MPLGRPAILARALSFSKHFMTLLRMFSASPAPSGRELSRYCDVKCENCGVLLFLVVVLFAAFVYLNNTSLLAPRSPGKPILLAHRGIAQRFDTTDLKNDTCTAARMLPPTHDYLENTIRSMRASFEAGADVVEIDVHPTTDGQFAVFHDWMLDCHTDGNGVTREHTMAELKKLDISYGYTADGGKTFPFRYKGVGLMPSLDEVLQTFPGRSFLINIKSNDPFEGEKVAEVLSRLAPEQRSQLMVYGGDKPIAALARLLSDVKTMSRSSLKGCLISYITYGWTGHLPQRCSHMLVLVPINVAPWLWGWPHRFLARMNSIGSTVFVLGPYYGGDFSTGIDTRADMARLADSYSGGILTNEIEMVYRELKLRGQ
jgi:glycerophosphoryl diester phosphodiesterase